MYPFSKLFKICFAACLFLPVLSTAQESQTKEAGQKKQKDPPWQKMNVFAQITGKWERSDKTPDFQKRTNLPKLGWHSEQGASLILEMLPKPSLGEAQKAEVKISGDFFTCDGAPLRLWLTTEEYVDFPPPVCDRMGFLAQKLAPSEELKLSRIMNHGGFPVILSQDRQAVVIRSQLTPKEVEAMTWYRRVTNPVFNATLKEGGKGKNETKK